MTNDDFRAAGLSHDVARIAAWPEPAPSDAWDVLTTAINTIGRGRQSSSSNEVARAEEIARCLIERRWGLDAPPNARGEGPLEEALLGQRVDLVRRLLAAGVSLRSSRGNAVQWAMKARCWEALELLWAPTAPTAEELTSEGWHWACSEITSRQPVAEALLKWVGPTGRGHAGLTPLHYAALSLDVDGVRKLLAAGADPAAKTTAAVKVRPRNYPASGVLALPAKSTPLALMERWRAKVAGAEVLQMEDLLRGAAPVIAAPAIATPSPQLQTLLPGRAHAPDAWAAFHAALATLTPAKAVAALKAQWRPELALTVVELCEEGKLPVEVTAAAWKWLRENAHRFPAELASAVRERLAVASEREQEQLSNASVAELAAPLLGTTTTTVTLLRRPRPDETTHATGLTRVGGTLPGLSPERWPQWQGAPMELVLVVDAIDAPSLSTSRGRAVAIFVSRRSDNAASKPYTPESAVVWLSEAEAQASLAGADGARVIAEQVSLPSDVWTSRKKGVPPLRKKLMGTPGRVGGEPLWLQAPERVGRFVLQADRHLVAMNLGDNGMLYVFDDTAFWQSL